MAAVRHGRTPLAWRLVWAIQKGAHPLPPPPPAPAGDATTEQTDRLLFYNEPPPQAVGDMEALVGKRGVQKVRLAGLWATRGKRGAREPTCVCVCRASSAPSPSR